MAPYVSLIHGVDSFRLLEEIDKQAKRNNRVISCLLQMFIAEEETKFGLDQTELMEILASEEFKALKNIKVVGLMGMATFTDNQSQVKKEFTQLNDIFAMCKKQFGIQDNLDLNTVSMGMSNDYSLAIECGSTMVRIGSNIFGNRNY